MVAADDEATARSLVVVRGIDALEREGHQLEALARMLLIGRMVRESFQQPTWRWS